MPYGATVAKELIEISGYLYVQFELGTIGNNHIWAGGKPLVHPVNFVTVNPLFFIKGDCLI